MYTARGTCGKKLKAQAAGNIFVNLRMSSEFWGARNCSLTGDRATRLRNLRNITLKNTQSRYLHGTLWRQGVGVTNDRSQLLNQELPAPKWDNQLQQEVARNSFFVAQGKNKERYGIVSAKLWPFVDDECHTCLRNDEGRIYCSAQVKSKYRTFNQLKL